MPLLKRALYPQASTAGWLCVLFPQNHAFSVFAQKMMKSIVNQHLECAAPKRWSKHTTPVDAP